MSRKVLLIAYYYPPSEAIGAMRPRGLAKYLPEFGWEATVLTPQAKGRVPSPSALVVETGYRDVMQDWKRRLRLNPDKGAQQQIFGGESNGNGKTWRARGMELAKDLLAYPDDLKGWIPFAACALDQLKRQSGFDAIISTAHPVSCHLIGARAQRLLQCPWIADFRDLWCGNANDFGKGILGPLHRRLERKTLSAADILVTVSSPWAQDLQRMHPDKRVESITNGFDPDDFTAEEFVPDKVFSIVYAGSLYAGKRDPTTFLTALKTLVEQNAIPKNEVRVRFYGSREPWLEERVRELQLEGVVEFPGRVPRADALRFQQSAQILLLLGWNGTTSDGVYTGKVFEYLNAGRPILLCGGERGVASELMCETQAGEYLASSDEIQRFLLNAYAEYRQFGRVSYRGRKDVIATYSHRQMAGAFAGLLDDLVGAPA